MYRERRVQQRLRLVHGLVVDRNPDDRALQQPAPLEPVQRSERHHLRQVTGNPKDDENVGDPLIRAVRLAAYRRSLALDRRCYRCLLGVSDSTRMCLAAAQPLDPAQTSQQSTTD